MGWLQAVFLVFRNAYMINNTVIQWGRHIEGNFTTGQLNHLNIGTKTIKTDQGEVAINVPAQKNVNIIKLGILSYVTSRYMANPAFLPYDVMRERWDNEKISTNIEEILYNEKFGEMERKPGGPALSYDERNHYVEWLARTAKDVDDMELYKLPADSDERIDASINIRETMAKVCKEELYLYANYVDRGKIEVWNIFRLLNKYVQAGENRQNYTGMNNILKILESIVKYGNGGVLAFYGEYDEARLAKLPNAVKLRGLIEEREKAKARKDDEGLVAIERDIKKEEALLKEAQINGNALYVIRAALESNEGLLKAMATRELTDEEITGLTDSLKKDFTFLKMIIPDMEKIYDLDHLALDVDNPDDMGLLASFYDIKKANNWTPTEALYILNRIAEAKDEAREFLAMLRNVNAENVIFTPKDDKTIGFLFGYTFSRIQNGWAETDYIKGRIETMGRIKESVEKYYQTLIPDANYKIRHKVGMSLFAGDLPLKFFLQNEPIYKVGMGY